MTLTSPFAHFAICLVMALVAGPIWTAIRREKSQALMAPAAFLTSLAIGQAKEILDLVRNPWSLPWADLRADSAWDSAWNLAGAASGAILLACASVLSAIAARLLRSATSPREIKRELPEAGVIS